ncbi:IAA-alanine resistance protein 1 [Camellia lanceoleosa]|uniref:IAA-alanine resistance protein 1 n=1 Tax=Camellia lanceoleosa TaxID=1840588 RepID=A0ACC0G170_9ERIC|nr:IAA-alanine resistance protein 1 [Camellia lanceoleosa]
MNHLMLSLLLYHHHKNSKKLKDGNDDDDKIQQQSLNEKNESVSEMSSQGMVLDEGSEKKNQPESLWKRKTGSGAGKDDISNAPNGSTHHIKSVVEKELSHSPSNLVFGYLNLFSDGVQWWHEQEHWLISFQYGGFMYIAVAKVLAEMNDGSSSAIKSIVLQLTSLIFGMAVTLCISLVE